MRLSALGATSLVSGKLNRTTSSRTHLQLHLDPRPTTNDSLPSFDLCQVAPSHAEQCCCCCSLGCLRHTFDTWNQRCQAFACPGCATTSSESYQAPHLIPLNNTSPRLHHVCSYYPRQGHRWRKVSGPIAQADFKPCRCAADVSLSPLFFSLSSLPRRCVGEIPLCYSC